MSSPHLEVLDWIDAQAHQFDAALVELRLQPRQRPEFGGADGGEVLGMRKQQGPAVADPVVKLDASLGGVSLEIGRLRANLNCHVFALTYLELRRKSRGGDIAAKIRKRNRVAKRAITFSRTAMLQKIPAAFLRITEM